MIALIDGDIVATVCAATAENSEVWIACQRAREFIERICYYTEAGSYLLYLSGPTNFRYQVYPEYKANRIGAKRPKWERDVKAYLTLDMDAITSKDIEADDMMAMAQTDNTIICSIDKDLDQVPGWHYRWEIIRSGEVISERKKYFITPEEGYRNFCTQLLIGDPTDNIKGVYGIGKKRAREFLDGTPPEYWYEGIRICYENDEELDMNAKCLYLWRKPNDDWRNLIVPTRSEEQGKIVPTESA